MPSKRDETIYHTVAISEQSLPLPLPRASSSFRPRTEHPFTAYLWSSHSWAPITIFTGLIVAILSAVGHYYFFLYLDGKTADETIPQEWATTVSHALARIFSLALGISATTAYTQLVWRYLRTELIRVNVIDTMLSATSNPSRLVSLGLMKYPTVFLFGLLLPLIPTGAIFPPSTLTVQSTPRHFVSTMAVPFFDPAYWGAGTFQDMYDNSVYQSSNDGFAYQAPGVPIQAMAKRVFLGGNILPLTSPCGQNCSYSITMNGPGFQCAEDYTPAVYDDWMTSVNGTIEEPFCTEYFGFESSSNNTLIGNNTTGKYFRFDIQYPRLMYSQNGTNLSCVYYAAEYTLDISFLNNEQSIQSQVKRLYPMDAIAAGSLSVGSEIEGYNSTALVPGNMTLQYTSGKNVSFIYSEFNQLAIAQSLTAYTIGGFISCFGYGQDQQISQTMILQSPLTNSSRTDFSVGVTPSTMEELLANVTISALTMRNTTTQTEVSQTIFFNTYSFAGWRVMAISYGLPVGLSIIFIALGLVALFRNGEAAEAGGLLQLLCTTTGEELRINKLARRCAAGTGAGYDKQSAEELKALRVRFGVLNGNAKVRMGFGTEQELTPLYDR